MRKIGVAVAIVAVFVFTLWMGGEVHYRNCIKAAIAATPPPERERGLPDDRRLDRVLGDIDTSRARRVAAVLVFRCEQGKRQYRNGASQSGAGVTVPTDPSLAAVAAA